MSERFASAKVAVFAPVEGVIFKNHIYHIKDRCLKNIKTALVYVVFHITSGKFIFKNSIHIGKCF